MNNPQQDMFYEQVGSRSPGIPRQHPQNLRQTSRAPMDSYGGLSNSNFMMDDQSSRYDGDRFDRGGLGMQASGGGAANFYGMGSSASWNPNAFAAGPLGGANTFAFGTIGGRMNKGQARGRANLPNTWLDPQSQMSPIGGFVSGLGIDNQPMRSNNYMQEPDDDLIPTAIVIKNIPFAVKKEQLVDVMNDLNLPLPYAFNYHFDNGVFRGLAFANFTSPEETAQVIGALNHYELQGRKLRVEYKKMLPLQERERIEREKRERRGQLEEQHRPLNPQQLNNQHSMSSLSSTLAANSPSPISSGMGAHQKPEVDLNDPETLQFYNQLYSFKDDHTREALIFPTGLLPAQRRVVHTLAHNLNLYHSSRGNGDQRQVHVTRVPQGNSISPPIPQMSNFHQDPSRRVLNRAATTDFSEARGADALYGTLRAQQSGSYLGVPDSPGAFANRNELRAAKSHADLRSYTPSPVPSSASFPVALQSNAARYQDMAGQGPNAGAGGQGPGNLAAYGQGHDEHGFLNGFANLSVGTNIAPGPTRGSPRSLRNLFSWDNVQGIPTGPIGSNRNFGGIGNSGEVSRERNPQIPIRQPSIPSDRGNSAFSRNRPNGHQSRGSDETRHSQPDIIPE